MCWNNDSCKTCKNPLLVHSNNDHCHKEACHDADTASERAMQDRLQAQYTACLDGADDLRNAARKEAGLPKIPCRKLFPTLQVTHDRENMEQLGKFKCAKDSPTTCSCKCDRHPPCCATKNKLLTNSMVFGNRFTDVAVLQDCCNMCTNHPDCTAWEVCCTLIDPRACALLAATLLPFALRLLTPTLPRRPPFAHSSHRNASASLRVAWFRPAATWPTPCRRRSRRGQALHRAWARAKCCTPKGARRMRTAAPHSVLISSQNHTRHAYAYLLDIRMSTHTEITHAHTLLGKYKREHINNKPCVFFIILCVSIKLITQKGQGEAGAQRRPKERPGESFLSRRTTSLSLTQSSDSDSDSDSLSPNSVKIWTH